jgi:Secretion system C-terminal sorting domain
MRVIVAIIIIPIVLSTTLLHSQTYSTITYDAGTSIEIQSAADVCATTININGTFSGGGTICTGPLPVTLSSFNASVNRNNVMLSWRTLAELNNSGFKVERMNLTDNLWKEAGFVPGKGTTNEQQDYSYEDKKLQTGRYKYRLKQVDFNGGYEYFQLESDVMIGKPAVFSISQNYPNPSNPKSRIDYEIPLDGMVSLKVYDILGREIIKLVDEPKTAGYYIAEFDGSNLASGTYFYRIIAQNNESKFTKTLKMILVK